MSWSKKETDVLCTTWRMCCPAPLEHGTFINKLLYFPYCDVKRLSRVQSHNRKKCDTFRLSMQTYDYRLWLRLGFISYHKWRQRLWNVPLPMAEERNDAIARSASGINAGSVCWCVLSSGPATRGSRSTRESGKKLAAILYRRHPHWFIAKALSLRPLCRTRRRLLARY